MLADPVGVASPKLTESVPMKSTSTLGGRCVELLMSVAQELCTLALRIVNWFLNLFFSKPKTETAATVSLPLIATTSIPVATALKASPAEVINELPKQIEEATMASLAKEVASVSLAKSDKAKDPIKTAEIEPVVDELAFEIEFLSPPKSDKQPGEAIDEMPSKGHPAEPKFLHPAMVASAGTTPVPYKAKEIEKEPRLDESLEKISEEQKALWLALQDGSYKEEKDPAKFAAMLDWVLTNEKDAPKEARVVLEQFVSNFVTRCEAEAKANPGHYLQTVDSFSSEKLISYFKLLSHHLLLETAQPKHLDTMLRLLPKAGTNVTKLTRTLTAKEGGFNPLAYHLQQLHHAYTLKNPGDYSAKTAQHLQAFFSSFTKERAEALKENADLWALFRVFYKEAGENFSPEVLGVLAAVNLEYEIHLEEYEQISTKKDKRKVQNFRRLIESIPENQALPGRLLAIVPYACDELELLLAPKIAHLDHAPLKNKGVFLLPEEKMKIRLYLEQKMKEAMKKFQGARAKVLAELAKKPPPSPAPKKFEVGGPVKTQEELKATLPVAKQPQVDWSPEQCQTFLKNKTYRADGRDSAAVIRSEEEMIFSWIIDGKELFENLEVRPMLLDFVDYVMTVYYAAEAFQQRLEWINDDQLGYFVKLLGAEKIDLLWEMEAKISDLGGATRLNEKKRRLANVLPVLSDEQLKVSLSSAQFDKLLDKHADLIAHALIDKQWEKIIELAKSEKHGLGMLLILVNAAIPSEDACFADKLLAIAPQAKHKKEEDPAPRKALKAAIQNKMILSPKVKRQQIEAILVS